MSVCTYFHWGWGEQMSGDHHRSTTLEWLAETTTGEIDFLGLKKNKL